MVDNDTMQAVGQLASTYDVKVAADLMFQKVWLTLTLFFTCVLSIIGWTMEDSKDPEEKLTQAVVGFFVGLIGGAIVSFLPASIAYLCVIW